MSKNGKEWDVLAFEKEKLERKKDLAELNNQALRFLLRACANTGTREDADKAIAEYKKAVDNYLTWLEKSTK